MSRFACMPVGAGALLHEVVDIGNGNEDTDLP